MTCSWPSCSAPTLDESTPDHGLLNRDGTPMRPAYCLPHLHADADRAVGYGTFLQAQLLRIDGGQVPGQLDLLGDA